jgi:hypothetical protein
MLQAHNYQKNIFYSNSIHLYNELNYFYFASFIYIKSSKIAEFCVNFKKILEKINSSLNISGCLLKSNKNNQILTEILIKNQLKSMLTLIKFPEEFFQNEKYEQLFYSNKHNFTIFCLITSICLIIYSKNIRIEKVKDAKSSLLSFFALLKTSLCTNFKENNQKCEICLLIASAKLIYNLEIIIPTIFIPEGNLKINKEQTTYKQQIMNDIGENVFFQTNSKHNHSENNPQQNQLQTNDMQSKTLQIIALNNYKYSSINHEENKKSRNITKIKKDNSSILTSIELMKKKPFRLKNSFNQDTFNSSQGKVLSSKELSTIKDEVSNYQKYIKNTRNMKESPRLKELHHLSMDTYKISSSVNEASGNIGNTINTRSKSISNNFFKLEDSTLNPNGNEENKLRNKLFEVLIPSRSNNEEYNPCLQNNNSNNFISMDMLQNNYTGDNLNINLNKYNYNNFFQQKSTSIGNNSHNLSTDITKSFNTFKTSNNKKKEFLHMHLHNQNFNNQHQYHSRNKGSIIMGNTNTSNVSNSLLLQALNKVKKREAKSIEIKDEVSPSMVNKDNKFNDKLLPNIKDSYIIKVSEDKFSKSENKPTIVMDNSKEGIITRTEPNINICKEVSLENNQEKNQSKYDESPLKVEEDYLNSKIENIKNEIFYLEFIIKDFAENTDKIKQLL